MGSQGCVGSLKRGGFAVLHKREEEPDRRQADIMRVIAVPYGLELLEEGTDQGRIQLLQ
ncbi:MAG: hypothetical protein IPJ08_18960 [Burkholderiales bacterium]|nr:hypothetical protein [Burkholderiales bacterium]